MLSWWVDLPQVMPKAKIYILIWNPSEITILALKSSILHNLMAIINSNTFINFFDGCYCWPLNFNIIYCFFKFSEEC